MNNMGIPPEDVEKPVTEHLIELRSRILRIVIFFFVCFIIVFSFFGRKILSRIMELVPENANIASLTPMESLYSWFYISVVVSFTISLPYMFYQLFMFAKPGLYPHERKFILRLVPISFILGITGALISLELIIPTIIKVLASYTEKEVVLFLSVKNYVKFYVSLIFIISLIFQLPIIMAMVVKYNIVSINFLKKYRLIAYSIFFVLFNIVSPDPSITTPIILTGLVVAIYEASIFVLRYI